MIHNKQTNFVTTLDQNIIKRPYSRHPLLPQLTNFTMATVTDSQEPEMVTEPLSFRSGDIDFSIPVVNESIYHDGILKLKVFMGEFALCNYSNIRSISKDVIIMAAAEFAHQHFANHPIYLRKILESSFKNQVCIPICLSCRL